MADLCVNIGKIALKNPLLVASGTFGYGREFADIYNLSLLGGICVKGTTLEPRQGNQPPRIVETSAGMLNSVGLQNPGVEKVIAEEISFLRQFDTAIIINIAGHSRDDYQEVAARLEGVPGIAALELNISCPNVKLGGMAFGVDCVAASEIVKVVRQVSSLPLIVKLSPNVTDICAIAAAVEEAGADAVALVNTFLGMAIDIATRKPMLANIMGGLSGPAIKPIALRMVYQVAQTVSIPVIGIGGICSAADALEFMIAGASAFEIGSVNFHNPLAAPQIILELNNWLDQNGITKITEVIGTLKADEYF